MVKKSSGWNLQEMQGTLVKDTEQRISDGFQEIAEEQGGEKHQPSALNPQTSSISPQPSSGKPVRGGEIVKGVQTYIPIDMYRRLNDIKLTRRENIANLVMQAIGLWLDVQEGKAQVNKVI